MAEWSQEGMTDAEAQAYNAAMDSGNPEQIKMAVRDAFERYREAVAEPDLVGGGNGAYSGSGFDTWDDAYLAMDDPRYETSPEYRKQIEAKLARSPKLG